MEIFKEYLGLIEDQNNKNRTEEVLNWVTEKFPDLTAKIAWNQPMFTYHGTFIVGFSVSKHHLAVSPERAGILYFSDEIQEAGYEHSKELIRFKWDSPIDYTLLEKIINFNISDKEHCSTFWRK